MRHVWTVMRRDFRENAVLLLIALAIPLVVIGFTGLRSDGEPRIATYEGSVSALTEGRADALVDEAHRVIYVQNMSPKLYERLSRDYSTSTAKVVRVHGEGTSERIFGAFLLGILFWVMTAITQPILMLAETKDGLHHALMMTNLPYNQYHVAKISVALAGNLALMLVFAAILGAPLSGVSLLLVVLLSLLSVTASLALATSVSSEDNLILVNTPLAMVCVFAELELFMSGKGGHSPVQVLGDGVLKGELDAPAVALAVAAASVVLYVYAHRRTRLKGRV